MSKCIACNQECSCVYLRGTPPRHLCSPCHGTTCLICDRSGLVTVRSWRAYVDESANEEQMKARIEVLEREVSALHEVIADREKRGRAMFHHLCDISTPQNRHQSVWDWDDRPLLAWKPR